MYEIKKNIKISISTEKNFGYTFSVIFLLISILMYFKEIQGFLILFFLSFVLFLITVIYSRLLRLPNQYWNKFGMILGNVVSFFVLFVIFFSIGTLTSIFLKLFKKDSLNLNFDKKIKSYWETRKKQTSMRDQF